MPVVERTPIGVSPEIAIAELARVMAASLSAGGRPEEADDATRRFVRLWKEEVLGCSTEAPTFPASIASPPSTVPESEITLAVDRAADRSIERAMLSYDGKTVAIGAKTAEAMLLLEPGKALRLEEIKEKLWGNETALEDSQAYNVVRDARRAMIFVGLSQTFQSRRGRGYWLEKCKIHLVEA